MLLFIESIITTGDHYGVGLWQACGEQLHLTNNVVGLVNSYMYI